MHAYVKTGVLMFALGLASTAPAAGEGGSSSAAAPSSAVPSGAMGAGRSGGSSASAGGGSTSRTGRSIYGVYRPAPALDPKRKISEQDCTKPIADDGGNLRCK
jgi:hypothetical protein